MWLQMVCVSFVLAPFARWAANSVARWAASTVPDDAVFNSQVLLHWPDSALSLLVLAAGAIATRQARPTAYTTATRELLRTGWRSSWLLSL